MHKTCSSASLSSSLYCHVGRSLQWLACLQQKPFAAREASHRWVQFQMQYLPDEEESEGVVVLPGSTLVKVAPTVAPVGFATHWAEIYCTTVDVSNGSFNNVAERMLQHLYA